MIIIDDKIHGMTTIKLFDPYCKKSNKLNRIPKNIIPSFSKYLIQNLIPLSYLTVFNARLFINNPIIIAKIIGDKGLFLNPRSLTPINSDKKIAEIAVIVHKRIPIIGAFILFISIF
tara:strand:- start:1975 stop:2325 length:351 start_codon:yes stop_codon:yes gene_type:complete